MDNVAMDDGELYKIDPYAYPDWGLDESGNLFDKTAKNIGAKHEKEDWFSYSARMALNGPPEEKFEHDAGDIYNL